MKDTAKILASLILIISTSCSSNQNNKNGDSITEFCDNELTMLITENSIPKTDLKLFKIRQDTESKIKSVFEEPYCHNLKLNLSFRKDSSTTIPITFNILYAMECDLPPFTPRLFCHVLINKKGQVLVESELCNIDSISEKVFEFYDSETVKEYSPNDFKKVFVSMLWDEELEQKYFTKAINGILKGYFDFVNTVSQRKYKKSICDLDNNELVKIKELIPFNLRTDFLGGFEQIDFLPSDLPPALVDSIEIELEEEI